MNRTERAVDPDGWDRDSDRFDAGTVGGAGAWVRRDDDRALVVRRTVRHRCRRAAFTAPSGVAPVRRRTG